MDNAADPIPERVCNAVALGLGAALTLGGGVLFLGTMVPSIAIATVPRKGPYYALALAGLISGGQYSGDALDRGLDPLIAMGILLLTAAIVAAGGYIAWRGSRLLVKKISPFKYIWLLPILYLVAYIGLTLIAAQIVALF